MKRFLLFLQTMLFAFFFLNSVKAQYCTPVFNSGCSGGGGITSFQFGSINQTPIVCNGSPVTYYHDFTSQSTVLAQEGIFDISVQTINAGMYISIWIDYNKDEVFDGSELALQFLCNWAGTTSTSVTIPGSADLGETRLRIIASANGYPSDPCFDPGSGNCSDFTVNIVDPVTSPTVTTLAATAVTAVSASLNATVNANNNFTHAVFNYGTDIGYGNNLTGNPWILTGNANTNVNATISNLTPNSTYHYEAVGYGAGGYISGGDMSFTTIALAPTVWGVGVTEISGNSATLKGFVNANNSVSSVSFEYGLTDSYGSTIDAIPSTVSDYSDHYVTAPITGLDLNTTYHYRIISTNSAGTSIGDDLTFTTLATLYCIPGYSTGCVEYDMGLTYFELNTISQSIACEGTPSYYHDFTSASTDLAMNGVYSVTVQAGGSYSVNFSVWVDFNQNNVFDGASELVGQGYCDGGSSSTFQVTLPGSVLPGSTRLRILSSYNYYSISDPCGYYYYGNCSDFTVNIIDALTPPTVTTLAATGVTAAEAVLNGNINANDNTTQVVFNYGPDTGYGSSIPGVPGTVTGNSNTDVSAAIGALMPNSTYHFNVAGFGPGGYTAGDDMTFTTDLIPPTVTSFDVSGLGGTSAILNGEVNANNSTSGVSFEYGLDDTYGTTVDGSPSEVSGLYNQSETAYITGLDLNTTYHYRIVATNAAGTAYGEDKVFTTTSSPYCVPEYSYGCESNGIGVTYFELYTISESIPCSGTPSYYQDYTSSAVFTDLWQNGYHTVYLQGGYWGTYVTVWIDYNQNNYFDADETIGHAYCSNPGETYSFNFTVPETSLTGNTRLRIMSGYYQTPSDPCSLFESYGNCIDFNVTIQPPAGPPTVTTMAATSVTPTEAVLNASINANGWDTHPQFQYGLDASYGTTIDGNPVPVAGTDPTDVTGLVSGLMPNTTYHYNAVSWGLGGYVSGDDLTFTTTGIPPTVVTNAATYLSGTGATLNGIVNSNNSLAYVTFEYGLDELYGSVVDGNPSFVLGNYDQSITANISGLDLNTAYHYRIISANSEGTTYGADMTFTTFNTPYCIPVYGTGCESYDIGLTYFGLNTISQAITCTGSPTYYHDFTSSSTDLAINGSYVVSVTAGYGYSSYPTALTVWIDYNQNEAFDGGSETIGNVDCYIAGDTYTFPFTVSASALTGNTVLRAMTSYVNAPADPCGYYEYGNCSDFTMNITDAVTPPTVTTLAATGVTSTEAVLNGTVNANDSPTQVVFHYGLDAGYGNSINGVPGTVTGNIATDVTTNLSLLMPNTTYYYEVTGFGPGGAVSGGNMTFTTVAAPPSVTTGGATNITGISATLNGTVDANNSASTVSFEYGLSDSYGSTIDGTPYDITGNYIQVVTANLTGLDLNTIYHYRIVSTNSAGTSYGNDMTFNTLPTLYCIPVYSYGCASSGMGITYFGLNTISQDITCSGTPSYYHDFTLSSTTDLGLNGTYSVTVKTTGGYNQYVKVWIDYNQNNVFDGASEVAGQAYFPYNSGAAFTFPITIPVTALSGSKRLRIMTRYSPYGYPSDPCSTTELYGNCNDFTVNLVPQGAPLVTTMPASLISGNSATLNGFVNPNGFTSDVWFEYGPDTSYGDSVGGSSTPLTGNISVAETFALTGLPFSTTYHYRLVSQNSEGITYGADKVFTTLSTIYCIPVFATGCSTGYGLTSFTLNTISQAIPCTGTPSYYHDYTATTTTDLIPGSTYSIGYTAGYHDNRLTVWIDYNHNNIFDVATEMAGQGYAYNSYGYTIPITIPATALTGPTRLRITARDYYTGYPTDPCSLTELLGNCEDFTVNILPPGPPLANTLAATSIGGTIATLNGSVNPDNLSTSISFEYGITDAYGSTITGTPSTLTGGAFQPVTAVPNDLLPNTLYHYRVLASNSSGSVAGSDMTFTTLSATTTQALTTPVFLGSINQQIIGIEIVNTGSSYSTPITSFTFNTNGCTQVSDISKARLYYTYTNNYFYPSYQFGSDVTNFGALGSSFSFSGSQALQTGTSYFWLVYDISPTGTPGNVLDAECTSITSGGAFNPAVSAPAGNRSITSDKFLVNVTGTQASTSAVTKGSMNNEILMLDFYVAGTTGTLPLNSLYVNNSGTDSDIASAGVKLFVTSDPVFATTTSLGTPQSFSSSYVYFSSLAYDLPAGHTYIWVTYDIASGACGNHTVDAYINSGNINVNGVTYPATTQNPAGNRTILPSVASVPFTESSWTTVPPCDWNKVGSNWYKSNSSNAGGTSPEMYLYGYYSTSGDKIITPPINTAGLPYLVLNFKEYISSYSTGYTLKVQSSSNGINWTDEPWSWTSTGSGSFGPYDITTSINSNLGGTTYVAFTFTGSPYNLGNWYIDNVSISTPQPPTVTTAATTSNNECTAVSGGTVIDNPANNVSARGVCWSLAANPDILTDPYTTDGSGVGTFVSNITGLSAGTTYHVRAYATNNNGTAYGNDVIFTTYAPEITGIPAVCSGSTTTLSCSVPGGTWSSSTPAVAIVDPTTGEVTGVSAGQSVITYTYTNANSCVCSVNTNVSVSDPPATPDPVTATPSVLCGSGTSNLNAISVGNTIYWYTVETGGTPIGSSGSGVDFPVTLSSTTTYFAESNISTGSNSQTFDYTGSYQTFTVPAGVYSINIDAYGAEGIGLNGYAPGQGGRARGDISVVPGQVFYVYTGGNSLFNGGGSGKGGANGGDGSDVRFGGTAISNRIIVAGGGGGAGGDNWGCFSGNGDGGGGTAGSNYVGGGGGSGYSFCGANGGNTGGSSGSAYHGGGGGGGGLTSGGAGAIATGSSAASPGILGYGGASNNASSCGATGGGGGGYYGGGGAAGTNCGAGQGGGGSSWTGTLANPYFAPGVKTGNGQVVISWVAANPNCPVAGRTPVTVTVGTAVDGGTVSGGTSVCSGTNSTLLTLSGYTGTIQWQSSINNITFTNIAGQTSPTFTAVNLAVKTYFKAMVTVGSCQPVSSTTDSITVTSNLPVSVSITANQNPVCNGNPVTLTASPVNGGASPVYKWLVNPDTVGTNSNQYTYIPNGGDHVKCVLFSSYTCATGNPAISNTITLNTSSPVPTIAGSEFACVSYPDYSYITETGMSSYIWNVSAGGTIISGGNGYNYVVVNWNTTGAQTVSVNYTNSYSCTASAPTVKNIAVNTVPVPTITGPATVCTGSTGNAYSTEAGMTEYAWAVSGGTITSGTGTSQITVTWNSAGARTVSVNYSNGCTPASPTVYNVTVNPVPTPGLSGPTPVCVNSAGNVYTTEAGMSNYSWSVSAGGTLTSGGSATDNTATVTWNSAGARNVHVNYQNSLGCSAATPGVFNVTVNPLPVPALTGSSTICDIPSAGNVYSTEAGMTGYSWNVSAGGTITSGGSPTDNTITITWTTAGSQSVSISYSNGIGCTPVNPTVKNVNVYSLPVPTITGPSPVCGIPSTGNFYHTETGMTGYSWTVSPGGTITSGGTNYYIYVTWNTAGAKTVSVTYSSSVGCASATPTVKNVDVYEKPVPTITGPSTICGTPSPANVYVSEAGMSDYSWTVSGGTITAGAGTNSITVNWTSPGARSVRLTVTDGNGCTSAQIVYNVDVYTFPVPFITGDASICDPPSAGHEYSTQPGMTGYIWTVSASGTITAGGTATDNAITVTWTTLGAQSVSVSYTDAYGCTPLVPTLKNVNVYSLPVPTIAGPASVCGIPSTGNYYHTETGMTGYSWTVSAGGTITSGGSGSYIYVTWNIAGAQTVSVTYADHGCTPVSPTVRNVDVYAKPAPTITGPVIICGTPSPGNVYVTEAGMTDYSWAVYGGTITAGTGTNSITVNWTSPGARSVRVTVTDGNGCTSNQTIYNVDVYALPIPVIDGDASVCDPPSAGHAYTTQPGMTGYTWNVSAGGTITSGQSTNTIDVTWNAVGNQTVDVTYTDTHGCATAAPTVKNVSVNLYFPVDISIAASSNPICNGSYVTYTATSVNAGPSPIYQWKVNGINAGWNSSSYWYIPTNGDYVTCILNSSLLCATNNPDTSNTIAMIVNPHPDAPISGGNQTVCSTTLPALLTATAPAGSIVDWYRYASGGSVLLSGSNTYSTSAAGSYYAESRDISTGCTSTSRTLVNLSVNTAVQYFIDLDGDGFGNPEVSVYDCSQPAGYAANNLDCNDNDPLVNPSSQYFAYTGNPGFVTSIVSPPTGSPSTLFHFEADYFDATNSLPPAGYPRVILDYEGNGSYLDPNDRVVLMTATDFADLTTNNGKRYFAEVNGLPYGTNWKAKILVSDAISCNTTFGPFDCPDVLHEPNVYIFANDITISPPHPDPSENIVVSAVVHNESDFDATNFACHLINQWDTLVIYPDIIVANLPAHQNTTVQWNITSPAVPAWCPMQVIVDYTNVIAENNELDNSAVRPFVNGNYQIAGAIVVTSTVSPSVSYSNQYNYLNFSGRAWYTALAVQLNDSSVAGATVDFTVIETGATYSGYTNSWGYFSISFPAPDPPGIYHIVASVTDFTLTGDFTNQFTILDPIIPEIRPNLALNYCHSVDVQPVNPHLAANVNLIAHVVNNGNATAIGPIEVRFTYSTGGTWLAQYNGDLAPGQSVPISVTTPVPPAATQLVAYADPNDLVYEWNETDGDNSTIDNMCYDFQPVGICGGNFWGTRCVNSSTNLYVGVNVSHLYDANPLDVKFEVSGPGIAGWQNLGVGTLNNLTRNCYCPYVVGIPDQFTFTEVGIYTFRMTVDPQNVYPECDEGNNVLVVTVNSVACLPPETKPNLTFASCHSLDVQPVNPHLSAGVNLIAHIVNNGNATAFGPIEVLFSYSTGETWTEQYNGNLTPGQNVDLSVINAPLPPLGTLMSAYVDPNNLVSEWNESDGDNSRSDNMCYDFQTVPHCGSNFWSRTYLVGQSTLLSVGMNVYHLYDANPVKMKFEVSGPGISGTQNLGIGVLSNATRNCWCPWVIVLPTPYSFFEAGTYTFTMTADPNNEYPECNEGNNVLVVQVNVLDGADMRILSQFINPDKLNPDINEEVSLIVTYENIGNTNVNDVMKLKVMVDEVLLDEVYPVPGLATGDHNSVAIPNTWSSSIPGAHVIRAIIDADNQVPETNESNNEATRAIIVGECANLYFQLFASSNSNPAEGDNILINTRIGNNGDVNATANVKFYYINDANDTIPIGQTPVSVFAHDSVTFEMPWTVIDNTTTLIAKIVDVNTLEFNPDDNVATDIIGGFTVSLASVPACHNESNGTLTAEATGGTAPYLYIWDNGYIGQTRTAGPGSYTVTVTDNIGLSKVATGTITEFPALIPVISGPSTSSVGSTGNVYTTEPGMNGYVWTVSAGGVITAGGTTADNSVTVTWNTMGTQSVSVNYTTAHGCTAVAATYFGVTVNEIPVPTISGPDNVCANSTGNAYYTEAGMTGYTWAVSAGGIITGGGTETSNYVVVTWTTAGLQTVSVAYTSPNGYPSDFPTIYPVNVNPQPVPVILGPVSACVYSTGNIYTTEAGMSDYVWTVTTGGTITAGGTLTSNSITVTWNTVGSKMVSVSYTDANGCVAATPTIYSVMVNSLPGAIAGTNRTICLNSNTTIGAPAVSGSTYSWTSNPAGFTSTLANPTVTPLVATTYIVTETVTQTGCTNSHSVLVRVSALPAAVAGDSRTICMYTSTTIGAPPVPGSIYSWTSDPVGFTSAHANPTVTPTVTTTYTVLQTSITTGCSNSNSVVVTVNPIPVPTLSGPSPVCNLSTGNTYTTEASMSNYLWTIPAGATVTSGGTTADNYVTITWSSTGTRTLRVNYTNEFGCTALTPKVLNVSVYPSPVPTIIGSSSSCLNVNTVYSTVPLQSNYTWTISPDGTIVSGQGTRTVIVNWAATGAKWIGLNYTNMSGCSAPTPSIKNVTVNTCKDEFAGSDTLNNYPIGYVDMDIYPNPNDGSFTAIISSQIPGTYNLQLYSNLGVMVYELKNLYVSGTLMQKIEIRNIANSIYTLVLTNKDQSIQKKVVIRK